MNFTLKKENWKESFLFGQTDMKDSLMQPIDIGNCTFFICQSGMATISLYNKKYSFKRGDILIANWDMHPIFIEVSKNFETTFCKISNEYFYEIFRDISSSFCQVTYNYPIFKLSKTQTEQLELWLKQVLWINSTKNENKEKIILNYFKSLLLAIDAEIQILSKSIQLKSMPRQLEILREFGSLMEINVKEHHDVKFYADKLLITPYYLSTITSKVMQETPKSLIDKQLIKEIKTGLLLDTPLKVIADELHFEDTSYMSRFFKRHTKQTPSEYKMKSNYS